MSSVVRRKAQPRTDNDNQSNDSTSKNLKPKYGFRDGKLPLRVASRVVVVLSLLAIVYFTNKKDSFRALARQNEVLSGRGQTFECSESYRTDLQKYEGCFPKECGRFVTDILITEGDADKLFTIAKKGLDYSEPAGGVSILDLHSGAISKGEKFYNIYMLPSASSSFSEDDFNVFRVVKNKIKLGISYHFGVNPEKLYFTYPTFFARLSNKKPVTLNDEYWLPHVDKATYDSFHYTSLLYLNDYGLDFQGGKFIFIDEKHNRTVEPKKGRVNMFTSGEENVHYVEKVTSGFRYAVTISFTCEKKYAIEDPSMSKFT